MQRSHDDMRSFAAGWIENWNRRDIDAVLSHFADEAEFISPIARDTVGESVLRGKERISAYWRAALGRIGSLRFDLDHVIWDALRRELTVIYVADLGGRRRRACEIMTFDTDGRQIRGEAFYGAET
jgi:steroid delta-isomerase